MNQLDYLSTLKRKGTELTCARTQSKLSSTFLFSTLISQRHEPMPSGKLKPILLFDFFLSFNIQLRMFSKSGKALISGSSKRIIKAPISSKSSAFNIPAEKDI